MDYDKMTIESLAHDCFKRGGYAINKQDLISRISFLCEQYHQSKVNNVVSDVIMKCDCKLERHERAKMELDYNKCMDCKKEIE